MKIYKLNDNNGLSIIYINHTGKNNTIKFIKLLKNKTILLKNGILIINDFTKESLTISKNNKRTNLK
jgi:hypothetical protein